MTWYIVQLGFNNYKGNIMINPSIWVLILDDHYVNMRKINALNWIPHLKIPPPPPHTHTCFCWSNQWSENVTNVLFVLENGKNVDVPTTMWHTNHFNFDSFAIALRFCAMSNYDNGWTLFRRHLSRVTYLPCPKRNKCVQVLLQILGTSNRIPAIGGSCKHL